MLKICNVNFPEGKLHIKRIAADGKGKGISITVGAEPLMVKYLEERKFQLYYGSTAIKFMASKRKAQGRGLPAQQN